MLSPYYLRRKLPHMKKYLTIAVCMLSSLYVNAQAFYIKGGLGYAFPQAGQSIDGNAYPYNGSVTKNANSTFTYNYKTGASFSAGFQGTVGAGYMFNDHVGVELDFIGGLAPKKYTSSAYNVPLDTAIQGNIINKQYAKSFFLVAPQLVVQSGGTVWNVYARGGIVLPLYTHIAQEVSFTNLPGNGAIETQVNTYDLTTNFSVGLTGAIGLEFNLNDNVSLWGELNMLSMSLNLKEQDLTGISVDGQSYSLTGQTTAFPYSKKFTTGGNTNATYSMPFSNIGIHAGIMYRFPKSSRSYGRSHSSARPSRGGRPE